MNKDVEEEAKRALSARGYEKRPHYCQRWVRQVLESVYGLRFDMFCLPTAIESGEAFRAAHLSVPLTSGSVPGDLLYKLSGSGGDGHVAIRILGNKVAENSSIHWDGQDARGMRSLKEFGHFDLIVRLPLLK